MIASAVILFALSLVPAPQSFRWTGRELPAEGYRLRVKGGKAEIEAANESGRFYARETLRQLGENPPDIEIEDWPAYSWRGLHLDVSRHFFLVDEVRRFIDIMAQHKFNTLHWHLTDNQGWRLPIAKCPKLNREGAVRLAKKGRHGEFCDLSDGEYGPFGYTREEVRDVVAYAAARHVRIVPEIEMPGHSEEVVRAYPELSCFGTTHSKLLVNEWHPDGEVQSVCPGKDRTVEFFKAVLDEVCELFPGEFVHIGGDECAQDCWKECPDCKRRMHEHGLKDTHQLQCWFMKEMTSYLTRKGKRVIGWDEILEGGLPTGAAVMSWRGPDGGVKAAKSGVDAVMCPSEFCYFDYDQNLADDWCAYPIKWGGTNTVESVYRFDPVAGIPADCRKHILGGQGNNWTELTCAARELDWKCWMRAAALSEVLWTGVNRPGFADFKQRMQTHRRRLVAQKVNCAPLDSDGGRVAR